VSSSGKEVFAGNPTLRPTRGVNYDLLLEHRFAPAGQLEIGIFHKCLQDPVYDGSRSRIEGGPYDGYEIIQPINGPNATLSGVEIGFLGNLLFLPGSLRNLRVTLNYAHTWSEARFDVATGRSGTAALQRTAPHVLNASLAFEKGPVAVSVGTSHTSATLFTYAFLDNAPGGATGPHGDTYTYPYIQVDAQARYILGKGGVQVIVVGKNLNNHVFGFYRGSPRWSTRREYYDRSFMLGLRYLR
jgi:TonB-dependent receptor